MAEKCSGIIRKYFSPQYVKIHDFFVLFLIFNYFLVHRNHIKKAIIYVFRTKYNNRCMGLKGKYKVAVSRYLTRLDFNNTNTYMM